MNMHPVMGTVFKNTSLEMIKRLKSAIFLQISTACEGN
ncbi:hypothetical protein X808_290 [Mannheimia varigena USDA-ARS-USMARC-1296]|uniref:Uncharacterized protein n=1 Tax=Mannheimia varigena USDA-ARS-USMARC-1296 TaxID=1433287 RepID=W0QBD8_9PAST|nr:hypothetical protein X808_290 [Mannheimia varigena USDA-ARS-USMARC-1296]